MYTDRWLDRLINDVSYGYRGVAEGVTSEQIAGLRGMQWILRREDDLIPYIDAIRGADTQQTNLARPQLFQAVEMVKKTMQVRLNWHGWNNDETKPKGLLDGTVTAADVVRNLFDGIRAESEVYLERVRKSPGDVQGLQALACALRASAQACVLFDAVDTGPKAAAWRGVAHELFDAISQGTDGIRDGVGSLHRDVVDQHLPASRDVVAASREQVVADLSRDPSHVDWNYIQRIINVTGDHEPGNVARRRDNARAEGRPIPEDGILGEDGAAKLRTMVSSVLEDYQQVFHAPGFVDMLRAASVMARWDGGRIATTATVPDIAGQARSDHAEWEQRQKRALYGRDENPPTMEQREAQVARWQHMMLTESARRTTLAAKVDAFVAALGAAMGVEPPVRMMTMSLQDTFSTLRYVDERPDDGVVVIYQDPVGRAKHYPDAILVARMPQERVANGVPDIETARSAEWATSTNFPNIEDFGASLRDERMRQGMFGSPVAIDNIEELMATSPHAPGMH